MGELEAKLVAAETVAHDAQQGEAAAGKGKDGAATAQRSSLNELVETAPTSTGR